MEGEKIGEHFKTKRSHNPWMYSTFILVIIVTVFLTLFINSRVNGNTINTNTVAPAINNAPNANANIASNKQPQVQAPIPKTSKPVAEAFVFAYCPYGLQFEKALSPVYDLLKNKADIKIVFIGAMHGEYEHTESLRQICIEKNYGTDKLMAYLNKFNLNTEISKCKGDDNCLTPLLIPIYSSLSIDKTKIDNCMTNDAFSIYAADNARAKSLGVSGSPTFIINNVKATVSRNPESIKKAICDSFTTAPSECSQTLSTTSASAGFGIATATSGNPSSAGGCAAA